MVIGNYFPPLFRIELRGNTGRIHQVAKQHCQMAPLASYRARLNGRRLGDVAASGSAERSAAISAELRTRRVVRITVRTTSRQQAAALGAEFIAGDSFRPALPA